MNILITGADGFIGRALIARLLSERTHFGRADAELHLVLVDQHFEASTSSMAGRIDSIDRDCAAGAATVRRFAGDIADDEFLQKATDERIDCVFHLASIPGGAAESDFELGLRVNLNGTVGLLERLRLQGRRPTVVFASTIGVYGVPLPELISEDTEALPSLSYGAHKLIGEILLNDYSRKGYIDGRSLRLPGIVARPPALSGMMSAFMSDLIRNLSAGQEFTCPVAPEGMAWWMSRARVVDNLMHAAAMEVDRQATSRVWLLPVLHASLGEVVAAIARAHGPAVLDRVTYRPNAAIQAQFANLPPLRCPRSEAAGFRHDGSLDVLVRRAMEGP